MHKSQIRWKFAPMAMAAVGAVILLLLAVFRAIRMPLLQDPATGRLSQNLPAIAALLGGIVLLALGALLTPRVRVDVSSSRAFPLALACFCGGGMLAVGNAYNALVWMCGGGLPSPTITATGVLPNAVAGGMLLCGVLGGVALCRLGLKVIAYNGTCAGMSTFSVLFPVLWAWFRLAWYELAFAATVSWSEKLYDFAMVIFQLLFLFKLARLTAGIGKATLGGLLALACGCAATALSACVVRAVLFFTADAQVYAVGSLAGLADVGIGLLALVYAVVLLLDYWHTSRE